MYMHKSYGQAIQYGRVIVFLAKMTFKRGCIYKQHYLKNMWQTLQNEFLSYFVYGWAIGQSEQSW